MVDSGAMPSLLMVNLKLYTTPASSSEPEIPNTGPLEPRPKFRVEQYAAPCQMQQARILVGFVDESFVFLTKCETRIDISSSDGRGFDRSREFD